MAFSNFSHIQETVDLPLFLNYFNIVVAFSAIVINLLVVYAYASDREIRRVPVHFFIFCLSISDELTGVALLIHFVWVQNGAIVPENNNVPCFLWGSLTYISVLSSSLLVILISWDRLQMVTHPFKHRKFTRRRAVLQTTVLLTFVFLYGMAHLYFGPVISGVFFNPDAEFIPCVISRVNTRYIHVSLVIDVIVPFIALIFINGLIGIRIVRLTIARIEAQRLELGHVDMPTSSEVDPPIDEVAISSMVSTETFQAKGEQEIKRRATDDSSKSSRKVYYKIREVCFFPVAWQTNALS
ncbi:Histamine H3 receptor [Holothuria leucospilota]|uniref:Histamine H3 receptor n=1 Tax=Holothuria leucospilota TaxID=206669 RepID=A0A9Q1HGI9_HOLLE|nr:Histamine H3 receptor [Holothuria leucospilota]